MTNSAAMPPAMPHRAATSREIDDITLARAKRGDEAALRAVIERHERPVFALLSRMLVGRVRASDVEDLAQETFLKMCRALPRFEIGGRARFSTWLLTIAVRVALDACRRDARARRVMSDVPIDDDESGARPRVVARASEVADDALVRGEARRAVHEAARALSDDQRAVLLLAEWHGFSHDEIARALDVEVGTVKSRLSRAKERMRRALTEAGHER